MWATGSLALILSAGTASACNLALVLALDVSSSVDAAEDRLQRQGLAAALTADAVVAAATDLAPLAITVFEWSGENTQVDLSGGWVMVTGPGDLDALATRIAATTRSRSDLPTAMGRALGHAAILVRDGPPCARAVIDVAGDGENNESFGPRDAYAAFPPFQRITVNALVITAPETAHALISWFGDHVLHGPGAFLQVTDGYSDYAAAMERKLIREMTPPAVSSLPQIDHAG
jgi:hypothetical protein